MKKTVKVLIILLLILLSLFLYTQNGSCSEYEKQLSVKDKVLKTAEHAMKINASAIVLNNEILCVVKDNNSAQKAIDLFYYDYANCSKNEILVNISWEKKPEIINVKEELFNIADEEKAAEILKSHSVKKMAAKTTAADVADDIKLTQSPSVAVCKYVKEAEIIKYQTVVEYSETLYQNQNQIKQNGIDGVKENIYKVEYINDTEVSRELIKSKTTVKAQNEILIKGTKIRKQPEFLIPASGEITSVYGLRGGQMHLGMDIANSANTFILASKDGTVARCEWFYGYGKCIDIKHNDGSWTRYGHLNDYLITKGDKVKQGQKIALMGNTGNSTGNHLHFEVRYGIWPRGRTVDPGNVLDLSQI